MHSSLAVQNFEKFRTASDEHRKGLESRLSEYTELMSSADLGVFPVAIFLHLGRQGGRE